MSSLTCASVRGKSSIGLIPTLLQACKDRGLVSTYLLFLQSSFKKLVREMCGVESFIYIKQLIVVNEILYTNRLRLDHS